MNLLQFLVPVCRGSARRLGLALFLFSAVEVWAHYCGPPVIRCRPGDIVEYQIVSDLAELGDTFYGVFDESDPFVADVVNFTPVARDIGRFWIEAHEPGTNVITLSWAFPPTSASGFCLVGILVSTNPPPMTAANFPFSAFAGDPVNAFTGELVVRELPDLVLGGPMPLYFARYYASRLEADGLVNSRLGDNWSHNFDWRAILAVTNRALIIAPDGLAVRFNQSGTNWVLQSPTVLPFQLVNSGTNVIFGDVRANRLYTFATNSGLLTAISDGKGNTHTLSYQDTLLTNVSDGLGRSLSFTYAGPRLLRTVSDGARTVGFNTAEIGDDFNLLRVTNALGKVTQYTYDNSKEVGSLLASTIYPLGNVGYAQVYDANARVIRQTRLGTNVTRFAYDTDTLQTHVTNAAGQVSTYSHSAAGQLLSLKDPTGDVLNLSANAAGRRAGITSRTGGTLGISYDPASGKIASVTNADGTVTRFTYTNRVVSGVTFHELSSVTLPDGSTEQFTYDAGGNVAAHADRAGKLTRMAHNTRGQLIGLTNTVGGVVTSSFNADGTLATRSDAESGTVTMLYDALRRPTNCVTADGRSLRVAFDALDRVVSFTDERTNTTRYVYDDNNRLAFTTNALGQVTQFSYDSGDRLLAATDRLGRRSGYAYDALDAVVALTNRLANATTLGWDTRQRWVSSTDPAGKTWSTGYDDEGVPITFTDPNGFVVRHGLDAAGFVKAVTNAANQTTALGRDALHRVTSTLDPLGRLNEFQYDSRGGLTNTTLPTVGPAIFQLNDLGLLARLTDQAGRQWQFNYTPLGRLTNVIDPLNRTNSVSYDARGRLSRSAFADGSSATNSYDPAGNLAGVHFSGGTGFAFGYDPLNRLTNAANLALAYDAEDHVTNTVSSGANFGAAYDAGGRLTNVTYNGGALAVTYVYDSRDRLTQVKDSLTSAQVTFFYDDAGRLTNVTRANGVNGIYEFDAAGRVTRIREGAFLDLRYTLDAAGQIAWVNATAALSPAPTAGRTNQFSFDAAHQVSSAGYGYDACGRLTTSPGHTFVWNAASQLARVDSVTNTYNGVGDLLTRADAGGTIRYHYNHAIGLAPIVAEQNAGTSAFLRYYVWTPDGRLLYMIDATSGNAVSYYHFDRVGSTLALTSGAGAVTDAYAYSPYGVPAGRTGGNPQPFTYVGRYGVRTEPAAGLYQMRARFYDPVTARFLSRDPVWPRLAEGLSLNPYAYAANNPLSFIDPSGLRNASAPQVFIETRMVEIDRPALDQLGFKLRNLNLIAPVRAAPRPAGLTLAAESTSASIPMLSSIPVVNAMFRKKDSAAEVQSLLVLVNPYVIREGGGRSGIGGVASAGNAADGFGAGPADGLVNLITRPVLNGSQITLQLSTLGTLGGVNLLQSPAVSGGPALRRIGTSTIFEPLVAVMMVAAGAIYPEQLEPRAMAYVNGQVVEPKLSDLLWEAEWYDELDDSLWEEDICPDCILDWLVPPAQGGGSFHNRIGRFLRLLSRPGGTFYSGKPQA
jgi:RHS repeat-associated protein